MSRGADPRGTRYIVGRALDCEILVPSARVSARHAELRVEGYAGWIRDLGSRYGTTINHQPVSDWVSFGPDDRIVVGNTELIIGGAGQVRVNPARSGATVCAAGLGVAVDRGRKTLLRSLSCVVQPGELVALMGLSGAGKSTLLKTLVGLITPSWGTVVIDGVNLATDPARARQSVGYVPQDDIVHADLTVREALRYGAAIRLPLDTRRAEVEARVQAVMQDLGIEGVAGTLIGSPERQGISGGQRKRVNLALELLPEPPLLILDEPLSGLSSEDASNVLTLLRRQADAGRTIIITTHQPSLTDLKCFDRVIYLSDGELVYFGPAWPDSAGYFTGISHKGVSEPPRELDAGTALARLAQLRRAGMKAQDLAKLYQASEYFNTYVAERLGRIEYAKEPPPLPGRWVRDSLRQLGNQVARLVRVKARNRGSLPVLLAQAPAVAILLALVASVAKNTVPNAEITLGRVLFFMAISAIWFGCSNAAREIVGERPILLRERMVGLRVAPYVASKLAVLGALSALQCAVLLAVTDLGMWWLPPLPPPPGGAEQGHALANLILGLSWQAHAQVLGILWLCSVVGLLIGLTVSAWARSSEAAVSATPLFLIPEILFSGVFVPVIKQLRAHQPLRYLPHHLGLPLQPDVAQQADPGLLHDVTYALAQLSATRWGLEGLLAAYGLQSPLLDYFDDDVASKANPLLPTWGTLQATLLWQTVQALLLLALVYGGLLLARLLVRQRAS